HVPEPPTDLSPPPTVPIGSAAAGSPQQSQGMRALSASMPTIHVFAVGDADDEDEQDIVADRVDDAVITHADAPEIFRTCHLQTSARPRILPQFGQRVCDAFSRFGRKAVHLLFSRRLDAE